MNNIPGWVLRNSVYGLSYSVPPLPQGVMRFGVGVTEFGNTSTVHSQFKLILNNLKMEF